MKNGLLFLTALLVTLNFPASAEDSALLSEPEAAFRKIGTQWLEFEETAGKTGTAPEWLAVQLKKIREDFKLFAAQNAETPWADDAYFFASSLENQPSKSIEAKLRLIEKYPESSAEEWTQNTLSFALPVIEPLDAGVRMDICLEYLKTGKTRELQMLAVDSAEKYPELGTQFEILVLEPEIPEAGKTDKNNF